MGRRLLVALYLICTADRFPVTHLLTMGHPERGGQDLPNEKRHRRAHALPDGEGSRDGSSTGGSAQTGGSEEAGNQCVQGEGVQLVLGPLSMPTATRHTVEGAQSTEGCCFPPFRLMNVKCACNLNTIPDRAERSVFKFTAHETPGKVSR